MNCELQPVVPGSTTKAFSRRWLVIHYNDVRRFINSKYILGTTDQFLEFAKNDPCLAHEVVNDFLLPNDYKLKLVREFVTFGSRIVLIEGDRGKGKTTAGHSFAEWFLDAGRQPYWVGAPQELPEEFERVGDPYDVPQGAVAFTDEVGWKYSARRSGSNENIEDLGILLMLRHTDRSACFMTQLSSLTDLNFIRSVDALVFKPLSLFGKKLEREVIGSVVPDEFMPKSKEFTHFYCSEFRTTFRHPLGKLWKEQYSTPFSMVTKDTVGIFIELMFKDGFDAKGISRELKARSYRIDEKDVEKMIKGRR